MSGELRTALLKVERAAKHIEELNALLREKRPFSYVLETNTSTSRRATYAEKNEAVVDEAAIIGGDVLHQLRTALDHAYWQIVSPHAPDARAAKAVQFPFSETAARLEEAVKNRLAHRVSPEFFTFIMDLRPHGEAGGNELLYLLHESDAIDKHRTLIPTADYKSLSSEIIRRQVPDFPTGFVNMGLGQGHRDISWPLTPRLRASIGLPGIPISRILKQQLDVPVEIVFEIRGGGSVHPFVPTLHQLVRLTRKIIGEMERFA